MSLAVAVIAEMQRHVQCLGLCQLCTHKYVHFESTNQFAVFTTVHMFKTSGIPGSVKHIPGSTAHYWAHITCTGSSVTWTIVRLTPISKPLIPALCFAVSSVANTFILIFAHDFDMGPGRFSSSLLQVWLRAAVSTECRRP